MRGGSRAGAVFLVLFVAAFVVSLNDLVGTFADADQFFEERFDDSATRRRDIAASYLLVAAGLAFGWFAHRVAAAATVRAQAILLSGVAAAAGMVGAAVAFATVPMSRWFGDLVDDPGLQQGQAVLPQLGWVTLGVGAMLPAAVFMVLVAREATLLPRWLALATYPAGLLVALTALVFMPLFLFVLWTAAVVVTGRRSPAPPVIQG